MRKLIALVLLSLVTVGFTQIQDRGLEKGIDEFTGTTLCEQWVVNLADPNMLTWRAILDERGVITFSFILRIRGLSVPWAYTGQEGVLLRFSDGEIRGLFMKNHHYEAGNLYVNMLVTSNLLVDLLAETEDVRFRLIDEGEGDDRQHHDGTLTVGHLAPLRTFLGECIGNP